MPELRRDPTTGAWTILAAERARRPGGNPPRPSTSEAARGECPFCLGHEHETPPEILRIPSAAAQWSVRVVPNKYPALVAEPGEPRGPEDALRVSVAARGHHEVIVEGPAHRGSVVPPTPDVLRDVLLAARSRYQTFLRDDRLRHVALFKNHGRAGGASLPHPHWQLAAVPIVPPALENELRTAAEYLRRHGRELWDDLLERETADGARVIEQTDAFVVLAAYAPQWTGEVWIVPRLAGDQIGEMNDATAAAFAATLWRTLRRVAVVFDEPPLNVVCHTAPLGPPSAEGYRWHARIEPRLGMRAGFELGSGIAIVTLMPEDAAEAYREA